MRPAIMALLVGGCRFDSGGVADGGVPAADVGGRDAAADSIPPDSGTCAGDAGACCGEVDGKRVCAQTGGASAACLGGVAIEDRECPPGSSCEGFVCTLEPACEVCSGPSCGAGRMCSLFAVPGSISTCCTPCFTAPRGCGSPGTPCDSSDDCASGVCVSDGGAGQCYFNCQDSADCGDGGVCDVRTIRVDGLNNGLLGCRVP